MNSSDDIIVTKSPEMFISKLEYSVHSRGFSETLVQVANHVNWSCLEKDLSSKGSQRINSHDHEDG